MGVVLLIACNAVPLQLWQRATAHPTIPYLSRRCFLPQLAAVTAAGMMTGQIVPQAWARNLPESNGAAGARQGQVEALVPIAQAALAMQRAGDIVASSVAAPQLKAALAALAEVPESEKSFKRMFDEYSTGVSYKQQYMDKNAFLVYYTKGFDGPDRPSIETESEQEALQKAQYGARNDAWLAVDDFRGLLQYLVSSSTYDDMDISEMRESARKANAAFASYLALAPADDVAAARWEAQR